MARTRVASLTSGRPPRRISAAWRRTLLAVPGYDSIATAEGSYFDPKAAQKALDFFPECLRHIKGKEHAGKPFELELWQRAIIANLFGWKRPDGTRRYREVLIYIPRKNGKTALAAGIALYLLFCDGEPGAEIVCAAADREQAAILFDISKEMVLREPALSAIGTPYRRAIVIEKNASTFKVLSADADTKHGSNLHGVLVDELHAQPDRDLVDVLLTSTGSRSQPVTVHLTTSDFNRPSICNEKHKYASEVRDGVFKDAAFLPVIYEAPQKADWRAESTWRAANPNLGVSIPIDYFHRECLRAQQTPTYENTFKRLHLNLKTEQDVRWLPMDRWDGQQTMIAVEALKGIPCYAGLDLASTTDTASLVLLFRIGMQYHVLPFVFIPEEGAREREKRDRVPYITWARQGFVEMTPGNVIDYDRIRARINELRKDFNIRQVACDRWNATQIMGQLIGDGFEVMDFGQGYKSMNAPAKELEALVLSDRLVHGGNPVLRWMARNAAAEIDAAGNVKPSKAKSTDRIDAIVALVMALGLSLAGGGGQSVYATRGLLSI